jgi:hypothetical protein
MSEIAGNISLAINWGKRNLFGHEMGTLLQAMRTIAEKLVVATEQDEPLQTVSAFNISSNVLRSIQDMLDYVPLWEQLDQAAKHQTFSLSLQTLESVPLAILGKSCIFPNGTLHQHQDCKRDEPYIFEGTTIGRISPIQSNEGGVFPPDSGMVKGEDSFLRFNPYPDYGHFYLGKIISAELALNYSSQRLSINRY